MARWDNLTAVVAVLTAALAVAPACAAVVFSDGTFLDSDWTATEARDTTAGGVATFTASQSPTGGNPDAYRAVTMTVPSVGGIGVVHLRNGATYSPAVEGAVQRIDLAYDFVVSHSVDFGGSDRILPVLMQGDTYYVPAFFALDQPGWHHLNIANRQADDFYRVLGAGPSLPDFSAAGSTLHFGYYTNDSISQSSQARTRLANIDNWSVAINVPEPATLSIAAAAAFIFAGRRRQITSR